MDTEILEDLLFDVKKEALERGYDLVFQTRGRSMFPILTTGDSITVIKCKTGEYRQGDIILYRSKGVRKSLVAHRFIKKIRAGDTYTFIAKGDTSINFDLPVDSDDVIGRIIKIKKKGLTMRLAGFSGKAFNLIMYFLSITRIIAVAYLSLRKLKHLIVRIVS